MSPLYNLTYYEFYSLHDIEKFADNIMAIDKRIFFYIKKQKKKIIFNISCNVPFTRNSDDC